MPIQDIKGLRGLKGLNSWNELSPEEKKAYMDAHPSLVGRTVNDVANLYDNSQYIAEFGKDDFLATPNKAERQAKLKSTLVSRARENLLKNEYDGLSSEENASIISKINGLTDDGFIELAKRDDFYFPDELKETENTLGQFNARLDRHPFMKGLIYSDISGRGVIPTVPEKTKEQTFDILKKGNFSVIDKVAADDDKRKIATVAPLESQYKEYLSTLSSSKVEDMFGEIFEGAEIRTGYGNGVDYTTPGIGLYKAFKNQHEMEDFGFDDKKNFLARYFALMDTYKNQGVAEQAITTSLQDYVHNHQTAGDWWGSAARGVGAKAAASFGQLYAGLKLVGGAAARTLSQGTEATDKWVADYLQGKDENGEERPWWDNLKFWNGMDQYGAFNPDVIKEIEDNGGVSPYNWLAEAGNEMNMSSALNEGLKMLGYTAAQMLVARGVGGIGKGAARLTGGAFSEVTGLYNAAFSSNTANAIMKYITPAVSSALNAIPISVGYAKGSFDEVLREATNRADFEAEKYVASKLDGLTFNVANVLKGNVESDEDKAIANDIYNWTLNRREQLIKQGQNPEDIDMDELVKEGASKYLDYRRNQYLNEYKESDIYKQMMDAARQEAASAYERNATIEFLRMCGVNYLFKQYQQDKSVRAAMNSNYPNLKVVNEAEKLGVRGEILGTEVSAKTARLAQPLKTLWGGFESNYMDDVTAAYAKGFSLGRYNDYVNQLLDPDKTAATVSWAAGFTNALAQAEGALLDKQSWYDGFIGALGSGEVLAPSRGLFRGLRGESWKRNNYSETQLANMANKYGISIEQYINGEFEDYVKARNPKATEAEITEEVNKIRREDGFEQAVSDGRIERLSVGEWINNRIYNPLLSQYGESAEREREFKHIIDGGNKAITEKRQAIEDMLRVVYATNKKVTADKSGDVFDGEEAKAQRAFELVSLLSEWMESPILSQSEFVQQSWAKVQNQAKGNITEEDIQDFYSSVENKSEKDRPDAVEFATERLKSNAQQLVKMKDSYDRAMKKEKESDNYRVIAHHNAASYVAKQLAFNESILDNRKERKSQLEQETGLSANETSHIAIAEYGSRKGAENALEAINEEIETKKKEIETIESLLNERGKGPIALRRLNRQSRELYAQELRRQLNELERDKARINEDLTNNAFDRILSPEEILSLSSKERAKMLDKKNRSLYSKEQLANIDEAIKQLELRDPNARTKVRDIARLQEAIEDTENSQYIMQNNMEAAADYYEYAAELRAERANDALARHHFREVEDSILEAETDEAKQTIAKAFSSEMLDRFISRHPENAELLKGIKEVTKVSDDVRAALKELNREESEAIQSRVREDGAEDTAEDTANKQEEVSQMRGAVNDMWNNIRDEVIVSPDVVDEKSMMGVLEELADRQEDSRVKALYDKLLDKLEKKHHARNSTVVESRKAKEAEAKRKQQAANNALGKNFGWDGYVIGDTVYHKDGREGKVAGFIRPKEGESVGSMKVAWYGQRGTTIYNAEDKSLISKTKPEAKPETPTQPTQKQDVETVEGEEVEEWTDDGGYIAPSEEKTFEVEASESDVPPVEVKEGHGIDDANSNRGTKKYRAIPGLLEGNALYRYTADLLSNLGIIEKRSGKEANDPMSNFFKWLENEHIELQEIIDREIFAISKTNPDIQFMYARDPLVGNNLVQVVEYTDAIKKIHEPNKDLGGVIVAGEGENAKEYLVIGTTYSHIGMDASYRIANPVRTAGKEYLDSHPNAKFYVHPSVHSKIAKIDAGRLVKRQLGEESAKVRKLSELFNDKDRNPSGITFDNAVLGIMYNDKYFVPNRTPSAPMFPPGKSDSTLGRVFLMIPAASGNYIPVALKTKITLPELTQGRFTDQLRDILSRVMSTDLERRRAAVKELNRYIVMDSANGEVINGFLVGNDKHNNVTLVQNGDEVKSWKAGENIEDFINAVMTSPFAVNITQRALNNPSTLRALDDAGVLRTDVSTLRTANAAYLIFEVGADGNPIKVNVKQPVAQTQKENPSRVTRATTINKSEYRLIGGEYYDALSNPVTDKALRLSIRYNLMIQQRGLQPAYTSNNGYGVYIINDNAKNPTVISRDKNGNISVLPKERAIAALKYVQEQAERLARAKAAEDEMKRIAEGKQAIEGEEVEDWDNPETPKPAPKPAKPVFIEPKHVDNVTYGPAIRQTKIHNKWEKKDLDVELHIKTTTDTNGTKLTKVVGWGTDGLEVSIPTNTQDAAILQVPDGYAISKETVGDKQVIGITELEERADGTVRANVYYKDGLGYSYGWTTLEREGTQQPAEQPQQKPKEEPKAPQKPKSNYDPNKATTKTLKELQSDKKVTTFGQLHSKMRKELNAIAQDKGWNWGKTAKEKEAFLKEKLGEGFHPEAITDVDTFIENLKNCK